MTGTLVVGNRTDNRKVNGAATREAPMRISRNENSPRAQFDPVTITLYWLTAALISSLAATGLTLEFAETAFAKQPLLDLHRSVGAIAWFVALTRVVWR